MTGVFPVALGVLFYAIVGMVVIESCRIWRFWWLTVSVGSLIFWPVILYCAVVGKGGGR